MYLSVKAGTQFTVSWEAEGQVRKIRRQHRNWILCWII